MIPYLYGGPIPSGLTIRRHEHVPTFTKREKRPLIPQLVEYVKAHPWTTAPQAAKGLRRGTADVTSLLRKQVEYGNMERRGEVRAYEYRLKQEN